MIKLIKVTPIILLIVISCIGYSKDKSYNINNYLFKLSNHKAPTGLNETLDKGSLINYLEANSEYLTNNGKHYLSSIKKEFPFFLNYESKPTNISKAIIKNSKTTQYSY